MIDGKQDCENNSSKGNAGDWGLLIWKAQEQSLDLMTEETVSEEVVPEVPYLSYSRVEYGYSVLQL